MSAFAFAVHRPRYKDAFNPTLLMSESLNVSIEQQEYIRDILMKACSDSRFTEKAWAAIMVVLTKGSAPIPQIDSLNPSSVALGSPNFDLHITGKNFDSGSKIIWNGSEEVTHFVSPNELTTGVDMSTAEVAMDISVLVESTEGVASEPATFTFTPSEEMTRQKENDRKEIDTKQQGQK